MKPKHQLHGLAALACAALHFLSGTTRAQTLAFTYQGRLDVVGAPANGLYDLRLAVYDAATGGSTVGWALTNAATTVSNGLFTVTLDFGPGVFDGSDRWLEIAVRPTGPGAFTVLEPRQPVTSTPYALMAGQVSGFVAASQLTGTLPGLLLAGNYPGAVQLTNAANVFRGSFTGSGAALTGLNASQLTTGTVPDVRLAGNVARTNQVWLLGGNAGTSPTTHYLGTSDDKPMEFRVNNVRALRISPGGTNASPNLIGGALVNSVSSGVSGATIGGGGTENFAGLGIALSNLVRADFGTIGGGLGNEVRDFWATIGGGLGNLASGSLATVAGGDDNRANNHCATISGGGVNRAYGSHSTVGGGQGNQANGDYAVIPGGRLNEAADYAFAAGRRAKANHQGAFVWGDSTDANITSTANNSVTFRASGGYRLFSNSGATSGVSLAAGSGAWTTISDRHAKENFVPVDPRRVLEKVAVLPIAEWNYKSQEARIRHLGPTAQDFKAAFGLGESDTGITTVDADGVALAAIQGLNQKLEARSQELEAENAALKAELEQLKRLVGTLVSQLNGGNQ